VPDNRASFYPAILGQDIWVIGGFNAGTTRNDIWRSSDGGATWQTVGTFPTPTHGASLVGRANRLWMIGAYDEDGAGALDEVWWSTDGLSWNELTDALPGPCYYTSVLVSDGDFLMAGGSDPACRSAVHRSTDGQSWSQVGTLAQPRSNGRMVGHGGSYVYAGGGDGSDGNPATSGVFASPDGMAWTQVGDLPAPRYGGGLVSFTPPGG
jgi:hypothetical protein